MPPGMHLSKSMCPKDGSDEQKLMQSKPYRSLVMCLMYLAITTRPDIAFAVKELSKFQQNPGEGHWKAAKHVLRYLKGTINHGLIYEPDGKSGLVNYSDSDWAGCIDTRNSTIGSLHFWENMLISWCLNPIRCVIHTQIIWNWTQIYVNTPNIEEVMPY